MLNECVGLEGTTIRKIRFDNDTMLRASCSYVRFALTVSTAEKPMLNMQVSRTMIDNNAVAFIGCRKHFPVGVKRAAAKA
jgi:hypothetical protein